MVSRTRPSAGGRPVELAVKTRTSCRCFELERVMLELSPLVIADVRKLATDSNVPVWAVTGWRGHDVHPTTFG